MCVVSNISDFGSKWTAPYIAAPQIGTLPPVHNPQPGIIWSGPMLDEFQKLLERVQELEDKLNVERCTDPKKQEFIKNVEAELKLREKIAEEMQRYQDLSDQSDKLYQEAYAKLVQAEKHMAVAQEYERQIKELRNE